VYPSSAPLFITLYLSLDLLKNTHTSLYGPRDLHLLFYIGGEKLFLSPNGIFWVTSSPLHCCYYCCCLARGWMGGECNFPWLCNSLFTVRARAYKSCYSSMCCFCFTAPERHTTCVSDTSTMTIGGSVRVCVSVWSVPRAMVRLGGTMEARAALIRMTMEGEVGRQRQRKEKEKSKFVNTQTHTHVHTHTHTHTRIRAHARTHTRIRAHARTHTPCVYLSVYRVEESNFIEWITHLHYYLFTVFLKQHVYWAVAHILNSSSYI